MMPGKATFADISTHPERRAAINNILLIFISKSFYKFISISKLFVNLQLSNKYNME